MTVPRARHLRPSTVVQQRAFLTHFAEIGLVATAAEAAGIERRRHYDWMSSADYVRRFEEAGQAAADACEAAMIQRGVEGWEEPVFQGGVLVGVTRRYSDQLLLAALKARRPEKFRDRAPHAVTAPVVIYLPDNGRG